MEKMTSLERVVKTLKREPVDRVPCFEWLIDKGVIDSILPGANEEAFINEMGLDAICIDLDYKTEDLGNGMIRDEWGQIKTYTVEGHSFPVDGPIHDADELKAYTPPDPHDPARYVTLEKMLDKYGDSKAIIVHLNDVYSIPSRMMEYTDFLCNIVEEPEFISDLIKMQVDVQLAMAEEIYKRGVRVCYTGDDYAYKTAPNVSPETFRELFYPELCRVMGGFKDIGLMVIKHTDGKIDDLLDMIIDSGIDCLDPIDRSAGLDLADIKHRFGDRVAIKGNVDCVNTLVSGTVEETIAETKECLQIGASTGSGYILSSSNSIHSSVRPENYKAMLDTWKKYRDYPIHID